MRVLITGGAGFIGSHLSESLVGQGHVVMVWDNLSTGNIDNLSNVLDNPNFKFLETDIRKDISSLCAMPYKDKDSSYFSDFTPDVIIHAAASYSDPNDWVRDSQTNCTGTARICKMAKEMGVKRLLYFQTSLCYGLNPKDNPLTTESEVCPSGSTYAITKTAGERIIQMCGVPYVSFRLANVCGPRNLSGPAPTFYLRISQGKRCFVVNTRRDFIFVKDLVKLVGRAVNGEGKDNSVYHISTGRDYEIEDMYNAVYEAMGSPECPELERRERGVDDVRTLLIDPLKTQGDFPGWSAATPLKSGIEEAVLWYQENSFGETFTHLKGMD